MMKQGFCLSIFLLSPVIRFLSIFAKQPIVYFECSQLYITSSAYDSNVNLLFTSLVSSAFVSNFNKLEISPQRDVVYGLFQCRGDLSHINCKDCIENSVSQLRQTCPKSTSGTIQLEGCFIKFDNTSFFGVEDKMEVFKRCGPSIGYNSDILTQIDNTLAYLVGGTGQYYRVSVLGSVQGMMQCVQDLNVSDCKDCVLEARGRLRSECETSTWGDMYLGKCYIRYADGGFPPIKGIDVVNINDDSLGDTRKGKNIKQAIGIFLGSLLALGTFTISVIKVYKIVRATLKSIKRVEEGHEEGKKETMKVKQRAEEAHKEAQTAKEDANVAKREARLAREESEEQKSRVQDMLSRQQRDWYSNIR